MAFWDIHDDTIGDRLSRRDLDQASGLPKWVNHIAFNAATMDDLKARRQGGANTASP